eukprot:g3937.t1
MKGKKPKSRDAWSKWDDNLVKARAEQEAKKLAAEGLALAKAAKEAERAAKDAWITSKWASIIRIKGSRYTIDHSKLSFWKKRKLPKVIRHSNYVKYEDNSGELHKAFEEAKKQMKTKSKKKCGILCRIKNIYPISDILKQVKHAKDKFTFTCKKKGGKLCKAITDAGDNDKTTIFKATNGLVTIYRNPEDGLASFTVKVNGKKIGVRDVNDGYRSETRRRRLLQSGGSGADS